MTDQTLQKLFTTDEQIDDVTRARIWAKLATRIEAPAPRRRWLPVAGALAVAAAAVVVFVVARGDGNEQRLGAPQGTVLTTKLGPHASAALQGPAVLAVAQTGDVTRARLEEGTLYAEFTGGPGRALHITAAGADIEVVGTLFAVEVHGASVCLSVAHGRVRIAIGGRERFVTGGERACARNGLFTDDAPIETVMRDALERHARTWAPDVSPIEAEPAAPLPTSSAASEPPAPPATPPAPPAAMTPTTPAPAATTPAPITPAPAATARAATMPAPTTPAPAPTTTIAAATTPAPAPTTTIAAATTPAPAPTTTMAAATPPAAATTRAATTATPPAPTSTSPAPAAPAPTNNITTASGNSASRAAPMRPDEALYRDADAALARGDRDGADRTLAKLLATSPDSTLADEALYERARIAIDRKAWSDARALLARLKEIADTPLAEPGAYLRCRIAVASKEQDICAVLGTYLREYRDGAHVAEVTAAYNPRCGGEP